MRMPYTESQKKALELFKTLMSDDKERLESLKQELGETKFAFYRMTGHDIQERLDYEDEMRPSLNALIERLPMPTRLRNILNAKGYYSLADIKANIPKLPPVLAVHLKNYLKQYTGTEPRQI
ncbi:MAG: hypothetical protein AB7F19_07830 [Candidatus Babeliales bacterium]